MTGHWDPRLASVIERIPTEYDPDAESPVFDAFMRELIPDAGERDWFQMMIGGFILLEGEGSTPLQRYQLRAFVATLPADGRRTLRRLLLATFGESFAHAIDRYFPPEETRS